METSITQSEAERGTLVVETVLWETLPSFYRKLDATLRSLLGEQHGLPLNCSPIKFSSWMGGDRDGNPNVTPDVTREICFSNREKVASLLATDLEELSGLLSLINCSKEVRSEVGDAREPYRSYLRPVSTSFCFNCEAWLHMLQS